MQAPPNFRQNLSVLRNELLATGVVADAGASSSPLTAIWATTNRYQWNGKKPSLDANVAICNVTSDFGKTARWEIVAGREITNDESGEKPAFRVTFFKSTIA